MQKNIQKKDLSIRDLSLWDENARFPEEYFNKSEKQLVNFLLGKKDFKIESLAKEIVKEFELPQLEKIVVYSHKKKNIVLEGNRRTVVYKLLADPGLTNDSDTRRFFETLASQIKIDDSFTLESLVTSDRNTGLLYVDRKHTKRNNEVGWGEQERHNYKVRRGNATAKTEVFRYELGKLVRKLDIPDEMKDAVLGKGFVTTFYRLVDSEPSLNNLGIYKNEDGTIKIKNQKEFENKLKVIVFDVVTKRVIDGQKLDSRFLNKTEAKEGYLRSIGTADVKKVEAEIKKNTSTNVFGEMVFDIKTKEGSAIYSARAKQYQSIIDPDLLLPGVDSQKIKDVFRELQKINAETCPTACALLLRTLMDISVSEYADKKKIKVDNNGYFRTGSGAEKQSLKEKIDYISSEFAPQKVKDTLSVFNGNSLFTDNLNKIAHSRHVFSSKDIVGTLWKNSKTFWEYMIEVIMKTEKAEAKKRR